MTKLTRFTAWVQWPDGGIEEVDVDAATEAAAKQLVVARLATDYKPGGAILRIEPRCGWYL